MEKIYNLETIFYSIIIAISFNITKIIIIIQKIFFKKANDWKQMKKICFNLILRNKNILSTANRLKIMNSFIIRVKVYQYQVFWLSKNFVKKVFLLFQIYRCLQHLKCHKKILYNLEDVSFNFFKLIKSTMIKLF